MKISSPIFVLTALIAVTILTSCNTSTNKLDEAKLEIEESSKEQDQAIDHYEKKLKKFRMESDKKIAANKEVIIELKDKSKNIKESSRAEYNSSIDALEKRNQLLNKKMLNYRGFSNDKWESFKVEFNQDMDELGKALKDFSNKNVI